MKGLKTSWTAVIVCRFYVYQYEFVKRLYCNMPVHREDIYYLYFSLNSCNMASQQLGCSKHTITLFTYLCFFSTCIVCLCRRRVSVFANNFWHSGHWYSKPEWLSRICFWTTSTETKLPWVQSFHWYIQLGLIFIPFWNLSICPFRLRLTLRYLLQSSQMNQFFNG